MERRHIESLLGKERAFLFLSLLIVTTLLTGFPDSLKIFLLDTGASITGGVIATQPAELKDYFIGLAIFIAMMVFLCYLVHVLRHPKPKAWYPQLQEEDEEINQPTSSIEQINRELKRLKVTRAATDAASNIKAKKITSVPNMQDIDLEHSLRRINAQLQGYKRAPLVLESPREKNEWDNNLEQVNQELAGVDQMKIKKVKILGKDYPLVKNNKTLEQRKLEKELQTLQQTLDEEKQSMPHYFFKRYVPSTREWQLSNIKRKLRKDGVLENGQELAKIEQQLIKLYEAS